MREIRTSGSMRGRRKRTIVWRACVLLYALPPRRFGVPLRAVKTYKNLYRSIYSFDNLYLAFQAARRAKRDRAAVASFEFNLEHNLLQLESELQDQSYRPGAYTNFYIYKPRGKTPDLFPVGPHERRPNQR
jgi:hypothetical protein